MDAHRPCPDSALLAAFLDGTLADYERAAVVSHLAECAECRAVALTVVEFREVEALDALWEQRAAAAPPEPLTVGGATRWTREKTRAPALLVAGVAALAAMAVPIYFALSIPAPSSSAQDAVSTLIEAAEEQRPLEARLSGAAAYAPPPSARRDAVDQQARFELVTTASNIRTAYGHDNGTPSRRALGVAALLTGELDDAIATLEIVAAGAPDDANIANDLAAAYYERAHRANRPDDLPAALSAVERVLYQAPGNLQALFNRALIITALGLRAEAESAWQAYIDVDPQSPWAREARERLHAVRPARAPVEWAALRARLRSALRQEDAEAAVRHHASATRALVENDLWKDVIAALESGDAGAKATALSRFAILAEAFARLASDRMYGDAITAAEAAITLGTVPAFVAAHHEYFAGMALMNTQRFAEARPVLRRARAQLDAVKSPFSARVQIELAASQYYSLQYRDAATLLRQVALEVTARGYAMLVTRVHWLHGMTAYAMNDFALSRAAYEEMLSSAAAAGDVDQWVMANVLLANLHDTLGDQRRAWQHRVEAATRLDALFTNLPRSAYLVSAAGDAHGGASEGAALFFQSLVFQAPGRRAPSVEVQVRSQRARSLWRLRRLAVARQEIGLARALLPSIADESSRLFVEADVLATEVDVFLESDRGAARSAAERLTTLPIMAHDHLRRARAHQQLADVLMRDGDLTRAEGALAEGFAALETFRDSPSAEFAIRTSDPVWRLFETAAQISLRRGDLARAFDYTERGRLRTPQERRAWNGSIPQLGELQRTLPRDTAVAVLTQLESQLQIWVIRNDDVVTRGISISRPRAAALVSAQLREIARSADMPHVSAELFDAVLRPVLDAISSSENLVVVADAPYNQIAFAGLWDRHRQQYLVENHRVVLAPSATAYAQAAARAQQRSIRTSPRHASIIRAGNAEADASGTLLAQSLIDAYTSAHVTRQDAATAKHVVDEVTHGDVVHVAAPVVANAQYPNLSHLQMADVPGAKYSGAMFAHAVAESGPIQAQLVALADGGDGTAKARADGTLGFARVLLAAGVPTVVSPVTEVDAGSVMQTWLDFHSHYAAGTGAAESLQRAQIAALSESNRRPGPWATLTVFGSAQ